MDSGKRTMRPIIIINEIPFPIPLLEIFSPSHIENNVPVVSNKIDINQNFPWELVISNR